MVTIEFGKNAKTITVLEDVYDRDQAQEIAEKNKGAAFGTLTHIMKAFDRTRGEVILTGYRKRYLPFWHIKGESFFEYHRKSTYQFGVRPEVQSVTVNRQKIAVQPNAPVCIFEGLDHCFEHYQKEIVQDAMKEKGKNYSKYLEAKSRTIRSIEELQKRDVDVLPVQIRASYLLTTLYKEILKPVQADEILDERVVITKLSLLFSPVHVFEFKEENRENRGTIEVDGITGSWEKGTRLIPDLAKKYWNAETMFDISTEIASTIVPGAGVGMILTKKLFEKRKESKEEKHRKELRTLFTSLKKR